MITWEEDRRDKLATRLRDEVCQALSAIKYFLESSLESAHSDRFIFRSNAL